MRHLQRLGQNLNVMPLTHRLQLHPELWDQNKLRTTYPGTVHSEVSDIWLRFNPIPAKGESAVIDDCECTNYPALAALPEARPLINGLMFLLGGERLGRVIIAKLPPGRHIAPHTDQGAPATYYKRYHIILNADPGVMFRCEDEKVEMLTGELWWMNNAVEHEVVNGSNSDRIHLIVDVKHD